MTGPNETDGEVLARLGTDAALWAEQFMAGADRSAEPVLDPTPGGYLHAFLTGAIEAGRSAGRHEERVEALIDTADVGDERIRRVGLERALHQVRDLIATAASDGTFGPGGQALAADVVNAIDAAVPPRLPDDSEDNG